jgi:hypothetical protein
MEVKVIKQHITDTKKSRRFLSTFLFKPNWFEKHILRRKVRTHAFELLIDRMVFIDEWQREAPKCLYSKMISAQSKHNYPVTRG